MLGDYKKAAEAFERAFALEPAKSEYALWLGRSYGRRAETAFPFVAQNTPPRPAPSLRRLSPWLPEQRSAEDLFDYYLEAPGFLGGGYDKAEQIAKRIAARDPAEGLLAEAELADRRKQFDTAEEQLRRAIELAPHDVGPRAGSGTESRQARPDRGK